MYSSLGSLGANNDTIVGGLLHAKYLANYFVAAREEITVTSLVFKVEVEVGRRVSVCGFPVSTL